MIVAKMTIYHDCLYLVNHILGGLWAGWESITCINTSSFSNKSYLPVQRELLIVFSTCGLLLTSSFPPVSVMMIIALCVYVCIYSMLIALWACLLINCSNALIQHSKAIEICVGIFLEQLSR